MQPFNSSLEKIRNSGVITLGVRDSSSPFSYLDDTQVYQGYSIDLCMKVVQGVQQALGLSTLKTAFHPVTSATRIPLLANGTIDLECGSTTNTLDRKKQVAFAPTMFITHTRLLVKTSSKIQSLADMRGKALVSTAGTSILKQVTIMNGERNLGMNILSAKDHAEAFSMLETGRAAAFVMDDVLLASLVAHSKAPGDYELTKEPLSLEPYGIMMRRDDPDFKKVVDATLSSVFASGELNRIYTKWFQAPLPPKGVNLNLPMTPTLKFVLSRPTDSGDPATYGTVPEAQRSLGKKK